MNDRYLFPTGFATELSWRSRPLWTKTNSRPLAQSYIKLAVLKGCYISKLFDNNCDVRNVLENMTGTLQKDLWTVLSSAQYALGLSHSFELHIGGNTAIPDENVRFSFLFATFASTQFVFVASAFRRWRVVSKRGTSWSYFQWHYTKEKLAMHFVYERSTPHILVGIYTFLCLLLQFLKVLCASLFVWNNLNVSFVFILLPTIPFRFIRVVRRLVLRSL